MLALIGLRGAKLNAASVGLGIARAWATAGRRVLFVDADVEGSALARRLGEATRAEYLPAERGLPSLIAARRPLTMKLLADHCYNLDSGGGSLWSLFAPFHPRGGVHAAGWLAASTPEVLEIGRERAVLVASAGLRPDSPLLPLLQQAHAIVFLATLGTREQVMEFRAISEAIGPPAAGRRQRLLVVAGAPAMDSAELQAAAHLTVAGQLPVIEDEKVLRLQGGRRERAFARNLRAMAQGLLELLDVEGAGGGLAGRHDAGTRRRARPELFVVEPATTAPAHGAVAAGAEAALPDAATAGRSA